MKKTLLIIGSIILLLVVWRACNRCSSEKKIKHYDDIEINVKDAPVTGDLENKISVPDGIYKVSKTDKTVNNIILTLKVKVNDSISTDEELDELRVQFLDEDNMPIAGIEDFYIDYSWSSSEMDKMNAVLHKGNGTVNILIPCRGVFGEDAQNSTMDQIKDNAKNISISTKIKDVPDQNAMAVSNSSDDNSFSDNAGNVDDKNWDKLLDDYDELITQYLAMIKKASNNDLSAISDAPAIFDKANEIDKELKEAEGNNTLTSEQINKLLKIEAKALSASADIIKNQKLTK